MRALRGIKSSQPAPLRNFFVRPQRRLVVFRSLELTHATTREQIVTDPKYAAFTALDPFFNIVQQGFVI
jgi:hypothetical protein